MTRLRNTAPSRRLAVIFGLAASAIALAANAQPQHRDDQHRNQQQRNYHYDRHDYDLRGWNRGPPVIYGPRYEYRPPLVYGPSLGLFLNIH
jgi:hypothetical protein